MANKTLTDIMTRRLFIARLRQRHTTFNLAVDGQEKLKKENAWL